MSLTNCKTISGNSEKDVEIIIQAVSNVCVKLFGLFEKIFIFTSPEAK